MDFIITPEQQRMKKAARDFLKSECPGSFVLEMEDNDKGFTDGFWKKMVDLDWMALIIPEEYGGVGGDFLDLVYMLEEIGRYCVPGPFFPTIVLGALSVMEYGSETQKRDLLPKIANGDMMMSLASTEPGTTKYNPFYVTMGALKHNNDYILNGTKLFVPDAHVAGCIICSARTSGSIASKEGITLFLVDMKSPGIKVNALKTIAGDKQFEVVFDEVKISGEQILGTAGNGGAQLEKILKYAAVSKCSEMTGGAEMVLEMAADYAKERHQFGKPIGSYQAVQHHCANMMMDLEGSRYITYKAAWMLGNNLPCTREVATAKAWVSDAYKKIVRSGHQIQGGAGFMIEHDMPLYSRRAQIAEVTFGDGRYHRNIISNELGM